MKAIILAAGKSPRLLPLTKKTPQCLLEVNGKKILERQVDVLRSAGINDILVVSGYNSDMVEEFCMKLGVSSVFNPFYEVSGMAMSTWVVREHFNEDCIVLYSDILFDVLFVKGLLKEDCGLSLAIQKNGKRPEAEKIVEKSGRLEKISKENIEDSNGEFAGMLRISPGYAKKFFLFVNKISKTNLYASLIQIISGLLKEDAEVRVHDVKNAKYIDIDFPENLKEAGRIFS